MRLRTRKLLDRSFAGLGVLAIVLMGAALVVILTPIISKGLGAYWFRGTVEFRRAMYDLYQRGDPRELEEELAAVAEAREPIFAALAEVEAWPRQKRRPYKAHVQGSC